MAPKISPKLTYTVVGLAASATLYIFGLKPYLEEKKMKEFESEAKAVYEMRQKRTEHPVQFKHDITYK